MTTPDIQGLFQSIVYETGRQLNMAVFYTFGSGAEIIEELADMSKAENTSLEKYPLIALVGDVPVVTGDATCYGEGTFNFIFANVTLQSYKSYQRIEEVYKPILRPLVATFLDELWRSDLFDILNPETLQMEITEMLNFGRTQLFTDTQAANDFIDVTYIKNLKLKIRRV